MTRFSANLGVLWTDRPLPAAVRAAAAAGFAAVELWWPYDTDPADVRAVCEETGLPVLGLNTLRGDVDAGDNGLSAVPGRTAEAREAIDRALTYARAVGADAVHVMSGVASGDAARAQLLDNLRYAAGRAEGVTLLLEPLNRHDAPDYFLQTTGQARELIDELGDPAVRMMFDCYHVQRNEGDVGTRLSEHRDVVGHVQIAGAPARGRPDEGELDYRHVLGVLDGLGWDRPVGAEYRPDGPTGESLGWMAALG